VHAEAEAGGTLAVVELLVVAARLATAATRAAAQVVLEA